MKTTWNMKSGWPSLVTTVIDMVDDDMKRLIPLMLLVALGSLACSEGKDATAPAPGPNFEIQDAVHNTGNEHFFWLPPMVSSPVHNGTFDGSLEPVVEICEWTGTGCVLPFLAEFTTTTGPGSETVRLVSADEHYIVNWHTGQFDVGPGPTYRISVLVAGTELGFADVQLGATGKEAKALTTNDIIGLKDGRTLPIKFRIEEDEDDPVFVIGSAGGEIRAFGGAVTLVIPRGALTEEVVITVMEVSDLPANVGLIDGTLFDFAPDGTVFAVPVELTIAYDENKLPDGTDESSLTLLSEEGGIWDEVPGSTVDIVTNTVTGFINGFSGKGGGGKVASVTVNPTSAQLDPGETVQLTATVANAQGSPLNRKVTWASSDPAVATVDAAGFVEAIALGAATITVTSGKFTATASIQVVRSVATVDVTPIGPIALTSLSETQVLTAVAKDAGGVVIPGVTFTWVSTAPSVVSVASNGTVTAIAEGTATITASANGVNSNPVSVTVSQTAAELAFTVQPSPVTAGVVMTPAVEVTAFDALGNPVTTFSGNVTVAIGTNPGAGTLSGTTTQVAMGVATFADLMVDNAATGYDLTASSPGVAGAVSTIFDVASAGGGSGAFVYVANSGSGTVSVISTATNSVVATIGVGNQPSDVAITPNGAFAYVTNGGSDDVSVVTTATNTVLTTIGVGAGPRAVAITPDGGSVYVTNAGSSNLSVISSTSNTVVATVATGTTPRAVAITPNGAFAYVANSGSQDVSVISTATNVVVATVSVGDTPTFLAITPNGALVYVVNNMSFDVSVISTTTNTVVATVGVGAAPTFLAITPDGAQVYVPAQGSANVSVISTATNTVMATVPVGANSFSVAITPNGARAYVPNAGSADVSVISTATNTVLETVGVGGSPFALSVTPDGALVYVANFSSATVSVIFTVTNTVVGTIGVGTNPFAVAIRQ